MSSISIGVFVLPPHSFPQEINAENRGKAFGDRLLALPNQAMPGILLSHRIPSTADQCRKPQQFRSCGSIPSQNQAAAMQSQARAQQQANYQSSLAFGR
jgi:hypothetical protein